MQDPGCKVGIANFDFRIADLGMQDAGCKIQDARCTMQGKEFRVQKAEMGYCNNERDKITVGHFSVAFEPIFQFSIIQFFPPVYCLLTTKV